jgi:2'-5' RNA ligase
VKSWVQSLIPPKIKNNLKNFRKCVHHEHWKIRAFESQIDFEFHLTLLLNCSAMGKLLDFLNRNWLNYYCSGIKRDELCKDLRTQRSSVYQQI